MIAIHVVLYRYERAAYRDGVSPQRRLVMLVLALNVPVAIVALAICARESQKLQALALLASIMYALIVFDALSYAYFHFFNLSETGRRIRILITLLGGKRLTEDDIAQDYSPAAMVRTRLTRLRQMGQIREHSDGRIQIGGRVLPMAAGFLRTVSSVLMGRNLLP